MKKKTIISVAIVIIMLFLARTMYSDYNLKKIIGACVLTQSKNSSIKEAKKICSEKLK